MKLTEAKQLNQEALKTKYENFDIVTANLTVQLQKASQLPRYDYSAYMTFANDIELYSMQLNEMAADIQMEEILNKKLNSIGDY
ncbi:hypothetical protein ACOJIU_18770 (plasmid) [Carnobacterium maltaromaticum]|uniref:hypothetical protein n=1 Tax=Carnobacterium maltaromaticum TaxID=2751 RepID=UPI00344D443D